MDLKPKDAPTVSRAFLIRIFSLTFDLALERFNVIVYSIQ
jgi:hypothetical protein